ncbi:Lysosomal-trafficking regulator [Pseudolycoriella hygida]|uniref:Lysosomal-trafficking regulator n=1 Tax=Pseudolycoriella hygida TaxID=35572 RepID=A0A9Q0NAS5_9DIPT|nr:Lysosomal-trafficking regulator [Pseudolycoriella hygida]
MLQSVLQSIENLKLPKKSHEKRSPNDTILNDSSKIQINVSASSEEELINVGFARSEPEHYQTMEFLEWKSTNYSCDFIASTILNLLIKLTSEENMLSIDIKSVCVQSLQFAVECYCTIAKNGAFQPENKEQLRRKALTLVMCCIENILRNTKRFEEHIDIPAVLEKLYGSISANDGHCMTSIQVEHETAFIYFSSLLLHKLRKDQNHVSAIGAELFRKLTERLDCVLDIVKKYYEFVPNDSGENLSKLLNVLCKTIFEIRNHEQVAAEKQKKKNKKKLKKTKRNSCFHHHENTSKFGCLLENLLLQIMQFASADNLVTGFQFFKRNIICCCNANFKIIEKIIRNARSNKIHKSALNFMKNNFFKIFYCNTECNICDPKSTADLEADLISLYKEWFQELSQSVDKITFLNHIAKVSKYLSFEASFQFFVDIVLPPFRAEKARFMESPRTAMGQEIMELCLNIFLCFLKDVRLIKGFFNAENVQHMEDLIVFPEFSSLTCCLLKIGVENLSFLGENPSEQRIMSDKLQNLKSNAISNVASQLFLVFDELERDRNIGLRINRQSQKTLDIYNQSINISSLKGLLHLGVVYWNLILQLLRTNEQFKNIVHETIVIDPCDLQNIVFNSFSCYLNSKQSGGGDDVVASDGLIKDIEEWLARNPSDCDASESDVFDTNVCDLNNCDSLLLSDDDKINGIFDIRYDIQYTDVINNFYLSGTTFDHRSHIDFKKENNFIDGVILNECDSEKDVSETVQPEHIIVTGVKKIKHFFANNLFDHFLVSSNINETKPETAAESVIETETEKSIYVKDFDTAESSSLFLQLFEITAGVMILSNWEQSSSAIRELKCVLMEYCNTTTGSAEEGSKVIGALQSLLKVAEMKFQCCFIANCHHSLPPSERAQQDIVNTTEKGEAYCCSSKNRASEEDIFSSDIEGSEKESTTSSYTTADEGYDGDAEVILDTGAENNNRKFNSSRYGSHVVNEDLCRIVIDILIDLSKRCLMEPLVWPKYLIQIATRLGAIRESIGGSLYLIRGFSKILASTDVRLWDLQKSILELITDIRTPESLSAYLKIMSGENAPVDLLLPRLVYLGQSAYHVQPSFALQFPTINDESIQTTCDPVTFKEIKQIHDYHECHKVTSGFNQSTYIMPLNCLNFSPWSSEGFTVTTWIHMKSRNVQQRAKMGMVSDEEDPFRDIVQHINSRKEGKAEKLHLLSVGSSKLLFTVYVSSNDTSTFYIQLNKPNTQYTEKKIPKLTRSSTEIPVEQSLTRRKSPCPCTSLQRRRKSHRTISPILNEVSKQQEQVEYVKNGGGKLGDETVGLNVLSSTYHAVKSTRIAIRNSLSQLNLFSSTPSDECFTSQIPLEVKGLKLTHNQWSHLSFSVLFTGTEMRVQINIDGAIQRNLGIPCSQQLKNEKFQILCVGAKLTSPKLVEYINNNAENTTQPHVMYSLSNVKLFRKCILDADILGSLVALGADCTNLTQCQIGNALPNFGFLSSMSQVSGEIDIPNALKVLKDNLIAVFDASKAHVLTGYTNSTNSNSSGGDDMEIITFGCPAKCLSMPSFQSATLLCGGMSTLLFLFAKVVELSKSEFIQSLALTFFLKIAHSNSNLYTEFVRKDFNSLIGPIVRSERCIKGINLLNSVLETACDRPVLTRRSDGFHVVTTTNANVVHPNLLMSIIQRYSDWRVPNVNDSSILATLLETFQALVRDKHPRQLQNIQSLNRAGMIPTLLNFCKMYLVGVPEPVYLSRKAAESIVNLIGIFAGSPPSSLLLDDIIKVLLLLHRPSESFITHDRSKFYFLTTSMAKQKKTILPISTRKLSLSIRRERINILPIRNFRSSSAQASRSVSLDNSIGSPAHVSHSNDPILGKEGETADEDSSVTLRPKYSKSGGLDTIVNYSGNDNRIKKLLNPSITPNSLLNLQLKRRGISKRRIAKKSQSNASSRTTTTDSDNDRDAMSSCAKSSAKLLGSSGSTPESGIEEDLQLVRDYEIIAIEDVRKLEEKKSFSIQRPDVPFESTQYGITQLQNGFFNLLKDFILILPDTAIQEVLSHYVTVDIILVMANHHDPGVRTSIVKLLTVVCSRLKETAYNNCKKSYHWYHLGNQIALHKADLNLVTAIVQWVTSRGFSLSLDQLTCDNGVQIIEKCGLHSLIAVLPQCIHDLNLTRSTFAFMDKLYLNATPDMRRFLIEIGILPSVLKALTKFFTTWGLANSRVLKTIVDFMTTISFQSLSSNGNISIVWDLLNGLSFMEDNRAINIQRSLRSTQAVILMKLLNSFFPPDRTPSSTTFRFNASDVNLSGCLLSLSEKKIRFELLINRIVQFLTHMESSYSQTDEEIKLIEAIVLLSVNGCPHGNSIIGWGLCPSRPLPLKIFITRTLYTRVNVLPTLVCNGKIIKTMAFKFMQTDRDILSADDYNAISGICSAMGITSSTASNLSSVLEQIEFMRNASIKDQAPSIERTVYKFELIAKHCIESAMKMTRDVVEIQNMERRILMNKMRSQDESGLSREWNTLIDRMTHEGAPWHNEETYPSSWEMDQTEGPNRTRIRLKRCHLNIDKRYVVSAHPKEISSKSAPLSYLRKCLVQRPNYPLSDQVIFAFCCKHLPVDTEVDGEIIVTESNIIFLSSNREEDPIIIEVSQVSEIWLRRYQHKEIGMEFFLETNISKFFIFNDSNDRDRISNHFADSVVQCPGASKLVVLTQQWKERQLTNWEYLIALNQVSGRTFQDLMQYPVFPWILAKYDLPTLDLKDPKSFRDLEKPIAVQHEERKAHFVHNYNNLPDSGGIKLPPYHYGSHYSNSGVVLHFMVRVPPFTQFFLRYQDNNFDLPDRTFHSVNTTWDLASNRSFTDVKELIPEFFCFPEMFENFERLNFGSRQSGEFVYDVILPPWANNSSRLFVLIHRQALESDLVRQNLHKWIDLIFGYKQMGRDAIDAINVFHPATYIQFSTLEVKDPVEKLAFETMVRTYGQMPRQLFTFPHPPSSLSKMLHGSKLHKFPVKGLRWGTYTGSPALSEPTLVHFYEQYDFVFASLVALVDTNVLYGLPEQSNIMQGNESDTFNMISWGDNEQIIGIRSLCDEHKATKPLIRVCNIDRVSCCGTDPQSNQLWLGHTSGRICVYQCLGTLDRIERLNRSRLLNSSVSRLSYNSAFRKMSSKVFQNKFLQFRLQFIRSIDRSTVCKAPIVLAAVSPTLGDIVTIHTIDSEDPHDSAEDLYAADECLEVTEDGDDDFVNVPMETNGKSFMRLHTINAKYVTHISIKERVKCVSYSFIKEGTGINVIATGFDEGIVRLWSSWDLMLVKEINIGNADVVSLCYSTHHHLVVLTSDNIIQVWESNGLPGKLPKFPQLIYHKRS